MSEQPGTPPLPVIDHRVVDWASVGRASYHLRQSFTYDYPGPIANLRQRLVVVPPAVYGDQRLVHHDVRALGVPPARRTQEYDRFGNRVVQFHLPRVESRVEFCVTLDIERSRGLHPALVSAADAPFYLEETDLTATDAALRGAARHLALGAHEPVEEAARRINEWVFGAMRYVRDVTGVRTAAADAFALGAGVCQDYAHVMLALCRAMDIPARYVSGHLLGEGGTHAWVEVLAPAPGRPDRLVALPFDPTHGRVAGMSYLTIAAGRDYRDVAPATGVFAAPYGGTLTARKAAVVTAVCRDGEQDLEQERGAA